MIAQIKCSVCQELLPSDLKDTMFYWGNDLNTHPLIIAHKLKCDPRGKYIYSQDVMPRLWKTLIYKKIPK
jgi:hypothetical protein